MGTHTGILVFTYRLNSGIDTDRTTGNAISMDGLLAATKAVLTR